MKMLYYIYAIYFESFSSDESNNTYYYGIVTGWCLSPFWNSIPTSYVLYRHHKSFSKIYDDQIQTDHSKQNHASARPVSYETVASLAEATESCLPSANIETNSEKNITAVIGNIPSDRFGGSDQIGGSFAESVNTNDIFSEQHHRERKYTQSTQSEHKLVKQETGINNGLINSSREISRSF